jgi:hypothetical protein
MNDAAKLDYSEEQQPLENFFRAKNIKTKNEMADDVRASLSYTIDYAYVLIVRSNSCSSTSR